MLDSNVFNLIADDRLPASLFRSRTYVCTHVQRDELSSTHDPRRRDALEQAFNSVITSLVPTETSVWNDSNWGQRWSKNDFLFQDMLRHLALLDKKSGKRSRGYNQSRDVRIAETALRNGYVLVTNDQNLCTTMLHFGGTVIYPTDIA